MKLLLLGGAGTMAKCVLEKVLADASFDEVTLQTLTARLQKK